MNNSDIVFSGTPSVEAVRALEKELENLPQIDLHTAMMMHGRMCARTIFIPAGCILTGCMTKIDNLCVIYGDITVTTNEGPKRITGFNVLPASKGFKRAGIAHADTWWTTVHHTDLTNLAEIEEEMTNEPENLQTRKFSALAQKQSELLEVE